MLSTIAWTQLQLCLAEIPRSREFLLEQRSSHEARIIRHRQELNSAITPPIEAQEIELFSMKRSSRRTLKVALRKKPQYEVSCK